MNNAKLQAQNLKTLLELHPDKALYEYEILFNCINKLETALKLINRADNKDVYDDIKVAITNANFIKD